MQSQQNFEHWRVNERFLHKRLIVSRKKQRDFLSWCSNRRQCRPFMKTPQTITEILYFKSWLFKKWTKFHAVTQWTFCWIVLNKWLTRLIKIGRFDEPCKWLTQPMVNLVKSTWKNDRVFIYRAIWIAVF